MPGVDTVLRNIDVAGQRRAAEGAQVERQDDMPVGEPGRDRARRLQLDSMALAVVDRERRRPRSPTSRARPAQTIEVEPARKQDDRTFAHNFSPSLGAAQNIRA